MPIRTFFLVWPRLRPCRWAQAFDVVRAERVYAWHCAVCHGADRGGYIGLALNKDETRRRSAASSSAGEPPTPMPQHPTWRGTLSVKDRQLLAQLVDDPARKRARLEQERGAGLTGGAGGQ